MLKDEIIIMNLAGNTEETYKYDEFFNKYFSTEIESFNKESILNIIEENTLTFSMQYMISFVSYFVAWFAAFLMYIIPIALIAHLLLKVLKRPIELKELLSLGIYSYTLPILLELIYMCIVISSGKAAAGFEIIVITLGAVYQGVYFNRKKVQDVVEIKEEIK